MGKSKNRSDSSNLRSIIRNLKSENAYLRKQLNKVSSEYIDEDDIEEVIPLIVNKCPKCQDKLKVIDLNIKLLTICNSCGYRKTNKK